jgi:integrase
MASISSDPNGNRTLQFVAGDGKRRSIRLGKIPKKAADAIKVRVEYLNAAAIGMTPLDAETAAWVAKIGDDFHAKLAAVGLVPSRTPPVVATLATFCDGYIASRTDVKPNTKRNLNQSRKYLTGFFGDGRELRTISQADADRFGFHMKGKFAEATAARVIKHARQFFTAALRADLVAADPFRKVKSGSMENRERMHFVSRADTEKLIAAAPDHQWRLLIALARYGGLRTPSEPLALTWGDVDWEKGKVLIRSPKTGNRMIPLFPELRPHLDEAFDRAEPGDLYVVTKSRNAGSNFRTTFEKIIVRAGLLPWEKPFQNLRASRETELAADHPLHVVTEWIGNSAPVAAKHYLQVTEADFLRASAGPRGAAQSGAVALQNPVQPAADGNGQEMTQLTETTMPRDFSHPVASGVLSQGTRQIPLTGVEPVF